MIQFKKATIHNFGSYGHAELDLQNRGFCLVSGKNNYVKDNALSNGSGKSFLWSAICFALTGETIGGIKSNLKNINVDEQDCFVQVEFKYNKDFYCVTRYISPKSDLKIIKNNEDVSGKGIRESDKKFKELLPDLTKDLIASTIIVGQGMPNRFSSFTPSGRKELLEKLTKSDFMIDDLKTRIQSRQQSLQAKIREYEDSLLVNKTQLNNFTNSLAQLKNTIENQRQPDFDLLISEQNIKISELECALNNQQSQLTKGEITSADLNSQLIKATEEKSRVSAEELSAYTASYTKLASEKNNISFNISSLQKEISQLKSITDVCPTCKQHLPNVIKPDTVNQENKVIELQGQLQVIIEDINKCNHQHNEYLIQIDNAFKEELASLNSSIEVVKKEVNSIKLKMSQDRNMLESAKMTLNKYVFEKQNWDSHVAKQLNDVAQLETEIAKVNNILAITSVAKEDLDERFAIVKKMDSLIKRDFRGYLLTNIIDYIDAKAKTYCETVFGTKELSLSLNGNALDITYCGKAFDSLSGGEKQRVDLILQLSIRELLSSYLDLSANILVLDEITDFLDKKSCQAVMSLLEKELKNVESVFIISHHTDELEIPIDSEIKVIKNENGISELF